ncbi:Bug family tripartite tricarboxylate transporter substrate binding protein [Pigmentiphaga kullae]|uniref:Tripartite-type tricarboxylate transporter receptor subunit TctC n=1 Tax=Pigmentiphaga kullae TaxID=151784 RepID=A0A4Q7ND10_9BURK|nr:tripartite tricarboxylate transporter substrate binding protein [Pigmentiphaga kullae]RZS80876.1 tripartite-type tricarboxylate transporter receptor subunit TctC [Pigmentiphaga kullae]
MKRFAIPILFAAVAATLPAAGSAADPGYPSRPIRLINPQAAGGTSDAISRLFAEKLAIELGQPVVVENKVGASTMIGADAVAKAAPDGYTLLTASVTTLAINPSLFAKMPYDPIKDFEPVSVMAENPYYLMASPMLPANNVQELIKLAKSQPGKLNYASPGTGTSPQLVGALLASMAGIDVVHVPYKGTSTAEVDMAAGRVQFMFSGSGLPTIKAGRAKALGYTGARRSAEMPDLPTVAEQGLPGFEAAVWNGLVAPAGTPPAIIDKLAKAIARIARMPDVQERMASYSAVAVGNTPGEFAALIRRDTQKWGDIVRKTGVRLD